MVCQVNSWSLCYTLVKPNLSAHQEILCALLPFRLMSPAAGGISLSLLGSGGWALLPQLPIGEFCLCGTQRKYKKSLTIIDCRQIHFMWQFARPRFSFQALSLPETHRSKRYVTLSNRRGCMCGWLWDDCPTYF